MTGPATAGAAEPVFISGVPLPVATVGELWAGPLVAGGGSGDYVWSYSGTLPSGITFDHGMFGWTALQVGTFPVTVTATDAADPHNSATVPVSITVVLGLSIGPAALRDAAVGVAYSQQLHASGGTGGYAWSAGQPLPSGLSLDAATGELSGRLEVAGTFPVSVAVLDGNEDFVQGHYTLRVLEGARQQYAAVTPAQLIDTRNAPAIGQGRLPGGGTLTLRVTGAHGVPPTGVSAVMINLRAVNPASEGYLTAYQGGAVPNTSTLNFSAAHAPANLCLVAVSADGTIAIRNASSGSTDVVADIAGYITSGVVGPGSMSALPPARILDTRSDGVLHRIPAHGSITVPVLGRGGIPTIGVSAALLNITAVAPDANGSLTAYSGLNAPSTSNISFRQRRTNANLSLVPLSFGSGSVTLYNNSGGAVDVILDVAGFVASGGNRPGTTVAVPAMRLYQASVGPGGHHRVPVANWAGLPAGISGIVAQISAIPSTVGFLQVYSGGELGQWSTINYDAGQPSSNLVTVPVGADGTITLHNFGGEVRLSIDLDGYLP